MKCGNRLRVGVCALKKASISGFAWRSGLLRPALSVAWLPDVSGESCKLVVGTHTDGSAPAEVLNLGAYSEQDRAIKNPLNSQVRTSSTTTRDRSLQFRGAVSTGGSPLDFLFFLQYLCAI